MSTATLSPSVCGTGNDARTSTTPSPDTAPSSVPITRFDALLRREWWSRMLITTTGCTRTRRVLLRARHGNCVSVAPSSRPHYNASALRLSLSLTLLCRETLRLSRQTSSLRVHKRGQNMISMTTQLECSRSMHNSQSLLWLFFFDHGRQSPATCAALSGSRSRVGMAQKTTNMIRMAASARD